MERNQLFDHLSGDAAQVAGVEAKREPLACLDAVRVEQVPHHLVRAFNAPFDAQCQV
ncbi:hypothetical protein [Corallococcus exercitus]|uniref:hypothetical protein n=1 Tax=Corallococcus exercitus TaxID=2316736 RepID=UPI0035D4A813